MPEEMQRKTVPDIPPELVRGRSDSSSRGGDEARLTELLWGQEIKDPVAALSFLKTYCRLARRALMRKGITLVERQAIDARLIACARMVTQLHEAIQTAPAKEGSNDA
jgi:hypothetical protein